MRVARLYDVDDIRIEDANIPALGDGEILVQTQACGICTGELMPWYIRRKAPFVFGHEPAGVVSDTRGDTRGLQIGDRVFVHHHAPCLQCHHCLRGEHVQCKVWRTSRLDPGGMAEYFRVPATNLVDVLPLPPTVTDADATLVEPAACAVKALDLARIHPGDSVLIVGLGFMGQILAKLARAYGAGRVIGSEPNAWRRQKGLQLGLDAAIDPSTAPLKDQVRDILGGNGSDIVIVGPPFTDAIRDGISAAGAGGRVVLFSPTPPEERLTLEPHDLYFNEVSLIPSYSCGPLHTRRALAFIAAGVLRAQDLVTHMFPFTDVALGYGAMRRGGDVLKAVIHFT